MLKLCSQKNCEIIGTNICCESCDIDCDEEAICPLIDNIELGYGCKWQINNDN